MKTKIIGIIISIMLLTTLYAAALPMNTLQQNTLSKTQHASSTIVDVPVWEVGNTWTYQVSDLSLNFTSDTQTVLLHTSIDELPLVVMNVTDEYYTLSFSTTMDGIGYVNADQGDGPVNVSVSISDLAIQGTILVEKTTLGIKDITLSFDQQKLSFNIIQQPYIQLPDWLRKISAKFTSNVDVSCDVSVALVSFPLSPGMFWDLVATNFTVNGKLSSFLFNVLNFINNFAKLFGKDFLPAEIAALLPIIDFHEALSTYLGTNVFLLPGFVGAFYCPDTETVDVPAGTYDAYNISLLGGLAKCYYAPTAGNVIQLQGDFQDFIPFVKSLDLVLLSTNYS